MVVLHLGDAHSEVDQTLKSIANNNWSQSFTATVVTEQAVFLTPISIIIISEFFPLMSVFRQSFCLQDIQPSPVSSVINGCRWFYQGC